MLKVLAPLSLPENHELRDGLQVAAGPHEDCRLLIREKVPEWAQKNAVDPTTRLLVQRATVRIGLYDKRDSTVRVERSKLRPCWSSRIDPDAPPTSLSKCALTLSVTLAVLRSSVGRARVE